MENWTWGQNVIGKSTPGSIYHGVQNTIWHRYQIEIVNKRTQEVQLHVRVYTYDFRSGVVTDN